MKRTLSILLAVIMVAAMIPAAAAVNEPYPDKVTISFVDISPSPEREKMYREMIEAFKEVEPNITVEYETIPWDDAHNKLAMLGATGSMPDVIQVHYTWISEFVGAGWAQNLSDYLADYEYYDGFTRDKLSRTF